MCVALSNVLPLFLAHAQGTFEYTFRPDKSLEANEYPFIVDMLYFSTKKAYRSVPFNHTIELEEPHSIVNTIGGPTFTLLLAFGALAYYLLVVRAGSSKKSAKPAAAAVCLRPLPFELAAPTFALLCSLLDPLLIALCSF